MATPPHTPPAGHRQGLDPWMLCSYRNTSNRMVIVRARGEGPYFLERVVFPFEIMTFLCPGEGEVEVITRAHGGEEQSEMVAPSDLLAGECDAHQGEDWRPQRAARGVSVRSNASNVCMQGQ